MSFNATESLLYILGSRADMASRAESRLSRLNSAASSLQGPDKATVDEVCCHFCPTIAFHRKFDLHQSNQRECKRTYTFV